MERKRVIRRAVDAGVPVLVHADGETAKKDNTNVFGGIVSIFDSVATGLSSVFGSLTMNKQLQYQQNLAAQQRVNNSNTILWVGGGLLLLVILFFVFKKK